MVGGVEVAVGAQVALGSVRNASCTSARADTARNATRGRPVRYGLRSRSDAHDFPARLAFRRRCSARAARPRPRRASTPAGRRSTRASTSATRGRSSSSRCSSASSSTRGSRPRWWPTSPTSTTRSTRRRGRAGVPSEELAAEMTAHYKADTERLGLGRPDHEPLASEYVEPIVALIADLIERGHAYAVDGDVYFRVRSLPEYGELSHRAIDEMDQGEGVEGAARKEDPLDFALWKGEKEGEDTSWPSPWGAGAPGLAHRVLGDGRGAAGRRARHPRRRQRPALPPPRERGGADAGRARAAARAAVDAQRDAPARRREDGEVGRQHPRARRGARRGRARRADHVLRAAATTGSRSPTRASGSTPPRPASRASARRAAGWARRLARRTWRRCATRSSTPWPTTSTPREALARLFDWIREANRREAPVGDAHLREMLGGAWRSTTCSTRPRGRRRSSWRWPSGATEARAARDFAEADRLRDALRAAGWEVRGRP